MANVSQETQSERPAGERQERSGRGCESKWLKPLAADCFPVVVERSLRFGFSGGFLGGFLFLDALHERPSLAFFVRLKVFPIVFHCQFSQWAKGL